MVGDRSEDIDVVGIADDELEAAVQVFFVRKGRVVGRKGFILDKVEELSPGGLVDRIMEEMYGDEPPAGVPKQVLVPVESEDLATYEEWLTHLRGSKVQIRVPQRGDKRELHETVTRNAREEFVRHRLRRAGDHNARSRALTELQDLLGLPEAPLRIEMGGDFVEQQQRRPAARQRHQPVGDAADAHAAKANAVVPLFATDEDVAMTLTARPVIGQRHLHRGISRLGAGVAEQHLVEVTRCHGRNNLRCPERLVIAGLKGRGVVERVELFLDGLVDGFAVVAGTDAPQTGDAIHHLTSVVGGEMHAVGCHENPWILLETPVGREGQPVVVHVEVVVGHG